ncbi:GPI ethanolamine phosphate transferase 1 isoform X1 [Pieris rapae]|uniref:GPI ethanolamine phosphate transferase 1 isoform X1 n=1 Tax=Pieris rapae TaxID=64459 RepID=UPI001E27D2F1|nr:GPI ethanolamine phosphate transferase 1 isoform X1 [Pieris rapae]
MFLLGIFIHIVFLYSIFDIYFKSPIVKNVSPYHPSHEPLTDRLVLFVVDGLRAESFLNYTTMPYLRSIANNKGRWGISNTRVPTESRPGHVAIIAGFYEDPSAVAKGWKENPVDFDSVFNQSSFTWCWGTYDIVDIFTKDPKLEDHIFVQKFDPYDQAYSTDKNTTLLDKWVFLSVNNFFTNAKQNKLLMEQLHSNKIVFFLHLLGTDTAGHTHKPKTQNFLTTLKHVDEGIKDMERLFRDFYNNDGRTTFLMTADHGMTDWGSHGTGYEHETKTPYVLWGSGVEEIQGEKNIDQETNSIFYEHRFDLNQADLTPLMATFLSIPVPVNSIGQLKPNLMNLTLSNKAKAVYSNSRQLLSQYNQKRLDVEANALSILYNPYKPLDGRKVDELLHFTEMLLKNEEYEQLIIFSEEIMNLSLSGLIYYHNYYQTPLLITITVSFLGWITYLLRILMEQSVFSQIDVSNKKYQVTANVYKTVDKSILGLSIFSTILSSIIIYAQSLPVQYYIYFNLPIFLWYYSLSPIELWIQTFNMFFQRRNFWTLIIGVLCYTLGSIAIGFSFSYRWVLSIPLLGISLWPTFSRFKRNIKPILYLSWPVGCLLLSIFSFSPVVGKDVFIELVFLGGFVWLLVLLYHVWFIFSPHTDNEHGIRDVILSIVHMVMLTMALQIIYIQSKRFAHGAPISQVLQTVCWFISALLPILPLMYTRRMNNRILGIHSSTIIFYLLMSVAHEGLFIVALIFNITCWMYIEFKLLDIGNKEIIDCYFDSDEKRKLKHLTSFERSISSDDFRRAFFFLLYIVLSYFGTGNIDSLNSYEVRWVLCFTTSFKPFLITGLIVMKTLSTQLSVACCFRAIQNLTKAPIGYTHIIVLIYSNIMGLLLLYCVTNTGSWLEIGTSISQFVIVQILTLIIVLINQLAKLLTYVDIFQLVIKLFKNRKKYV